jgi:hypothetical protein
MRALKHGGMKFILHAPLVTAALATMVSLRLGNGASSVLDERKCELLAPSNRRSLVVVELE